MNTTCYQSGCRWSAFFLKIEKSMGNLSQLQNDLKTNTDYEQLLLEPIITKTQTTTISQGNTRKSMKDLGSLLVG